MAFPLYEDPDQAPRLTTILRLAHGLSVEPGELVNRLDGGETQETA